MSLFSRTRFPANLSEFEPGSYPAIPIGATIPMPLEANRSCTFLLGPMAEGRGDELILWISKELSRRKRGYTDEELIWEMVQVLTLNWSYFSDRNLAELEPFVLYQARLKEYPHREVSEIIKTAKASMSRGNPLEFVYSSRRNFTNEEWRESSVHTVNVKSIDKEGFVGVTELGPRRFTWQRVECAGLLAPGKVEAERSIRFDFVAGERKAGLWKSSPKKLQEPHVRIALGNNLGKGLYSYGYPKFAIHNLGFGNS